jgi:hypothetical protein
MEKVRVGNTCSRGRHKREGIFYIRSGIVSGGENGCRKATNGKTVRVRVKKERKRERERGTARKRDCLRERGFELRERERERVGRKQHKSS